MRNIPLFRRLLLPATPAAALVLCGGLLAGRTFADGATSSASLPRSG